MPRSQMKSYEQRLVESVAEAIESDADKIAANHGAPPGQRERSQPERVRLWGRTDPSVDYGTFFTALLTEGIPPEQMAGTVLGRVFGARYPELLAAYSQPVADSALAHQLTEMARYPFRLPLYDHLQGKDRVTEAERLDREWKKAQAPVVPTTPSAPTVPSTPSVPAVPNVPAQPQAAAMPSPAPAALTEGY